MSRSRISYINKDVLALFITLSLSIVLLFSNSSPQIQQLKFQISWLFGKVAYPINWYKDVLIVKEENRKLKNDVVQLSLLNSELESYRQENKRLKEMLNFSQYQAVNYLTANVVNYHLGIINQTITIDIGELDGLSKNLPVLDENGLLGKTIQFNDHATMVQLITDKNYRVSIRIGKDRTLGIFFPTHGKYGILEGVRKTTPLHAGDIAYTSGISEIYPPNIPVAQIISISKEKNQAFQRVVVEILGSIFTLDYVFVIL